MTIIKPDTNETVIQVIDQILLPFRFEIKELYTVRDVYSAICDMTIRGAPLIGATAAWGAVYHYCRQYGRTPKIALAIKNLCLNESLTNALSL